MAKALRSGIAVRLTGARPGTARLTLKLGRKVVGGATVRVAKGGTGSGVLRFTTAGRRAIGSRRQVTLTVGGGGLTTRTLKLTR